MPFSGLDASFSSSWVDIPASSKDELHKLDGKALYNLDKMPWVPKGVEFSLKVEAYFF
jgi:hypothetical protein